MASVYSVSQVNNYIKNMFEQDFLLKRVQIKGEISNCKYHGSGHIYFTLKDSGATLSCVMWASHRRGLKFELKEGQNVIAEGTVAVYEKDGKFQLYASSIVLDGVGALYQRFEELKVRLEEMGMFAREYKRPIPQYASRVGIVTSETGAAIQDIINVSARRNPFVQLVLYPAQVQGDGAKETIVKGIQTLDKLGLDVIIVGRGGGSIEDLWAFNEECVAMAVFNCMTPVISAVGHETDTTIIDFVSDFRAPTPSAAAEIAVFDYRIFENKITEYERRLTSVLRSKFSSRFERLEQYRLKLLRLYNPAQKILQKRQYLLDAEEYLERYMKDVLSARRQKLAVCSERLNGLSPLRQLMRGYAYVTTETGEQAVTSVKNVNKGDSLRICMSDGVLTAEVVAMSEKDLIKE